MISSWSQFLAFLHQSAMGCLFCCFGIRYDRHRQSAHLVSQPPPSDGTEPVLYRNRRRPGSLLLSEENHGAICNEKQYDSEESLEPDFDLIVLKDEAKFLKACGTLCETPAEIRKASQKLKDSSLDRDSESLKFHSWLPNTSIQKLNLDIQPDQPPTPVKLCEEWVTGSGSLAHTPSSCISSGQIPAGISTSTPEGSGIDSFGTGILVHNNQTASVQSRNKSVRFDFDYQSDVSSFSSKGSSSEISSQNSKQSEPAGNESVSKPSPYPTPLKLTDDMQTPGTVFPSYARNMGNGKNPRIRSQYVYSVLNPVDKFLKWKDLKEETSKSNSNQPSAQLLESLEQADIATFDSEMGMIETYVDKESKVEESLSSCLKPLPTNGKGNIQRVVSFASENAYFGKTPGDRSILGTVVSHCNEDEPSHISPKWWDGNGIPNTTNKYKEDQKVSWHATPFEERLEKALPEETFTERKKILSVTPSMGLSDRECDPAVSQLKSSTHSSSVVSC